MRRMMLVIFSIMLTGSLFLSSSSLLYADKKEEIEKAVKALNTMSKEGKSKAMEDLVEYGSDAIEPLLAAAKDRSNISSWRSKCVHVLGEIKDTSSSEDIISIIIDEKDASRVRKEAIRAIGKIGDKSAVVHLIKLLEDENEGIRFYTVEALGRLADSSIGYRISGILLSDPNERVRIEAMRTLEALDATSESSAVMSALADSEPFLRAYAAQLCGIWKINKALPKIIQMLKYENEDIVKLSCVQVLGLYKDISAVPVLMSVLSTANTDLKIYAADSLKQISGKDFGYKREEWQKWYDEERLR